MRTPVVHVEVVEQTRDALVLRLWESNPNEVQTRTLAAADIADLVDSVESAYYSPRPVTLGEVGERLFRWLDGGERMLSRAIQAHANQADVVTLAIATPHRLGHLPWEVLHDGTKFLVHAPNPPVLPVRWQPAAAGGILPTQNRPLQVLFMAASPLNVHPALDYEREEAVILDSAAHAGLDLIVEESGSLAELGTLVEDYPAGFFDVLHLTGHADHDDHNTPVFLLEDDEGRLKHATPLELARGISRRPPLIFLSGCRTGQNPAHGEVHSFAEQLLGAGFRAVLGWGKPVLDSDAILAAQFLYKELSKGTTLALALSRTHAALQQHPERVRDWHLLRLFCAGDLPGSFVTPLKTPGRKRPDPRLAESEFLDPRTRLMKVATRAGFVGRRRLLQRSLRVLRERQNQHVGLLLTGQGGRGKSSVAARLCDRLRRDFQRIVILGKLDEASFIQAWMPELADDDELRRAVADHQQELRFRIQHAIETLAEAGQIEPLFVIDDFEQNQPDAELGDLQLSTSAALVLNALIQALEHTGRGRILLTCRYALPEPFASHLVRLDVEPLDDNERRKQNLRLDQKAARRTKAVDLLQRAQNAADGNPRLFEWLHAILERHDLDLEQITEEMTRTEERFREHVLARHLIASLSVDTRVLLGRLLLFTVPVPFAAVQALEPATPVADLMRSLEHARDLSLVDVSTDGGEPVYRVPRQFAGAVSPLLPEPEGKEREELAGRGCDVLYQSWWKAATPITESQALEIIRLASLSGRNVVLEEVAGVLTASWLSSYRHQETAELIELILDGARRPHRLVMNLARAKLSLGEGGEAGDLFKEAVAKCPPDQGRQLVLVLLHYADWLTQTGNLVEVERVCREQLLPLTTAAKDEHHHAVTKGRIADILMVRGELDEALRIRLEEVLPVYERLGDVRDQAVAKGRIADILMARGELDEALRIHREEELPIYERLGDVRSRAMTQSKIAEVLIGRGELDEALRIFREEQLPVYERLGDVRARAVTQGKIADALMVRGELDEALRLRREEELPVYERLGDVRELVIARTKIALSLLHRGNQIDLKEAFEHLLWAFQNAASRGYKEAGQIADILDRLGLSANAASQLERKEEQS